MGTFNLPSISTEIAEFSLPNDLDAYELDASEPTSFDFPSVPPGSNFDRKMAAYFLSLSQPASLARKEVAPANPEAANPEPIAIEPANPEPIALEPANLEPIAPEPANPEPIAPEPANPEPIAPEPANPEPVVPEPANPEPASASNLEPAKPTGPSSKPVHEPCLAAPPKAERKRAAPAPAGSDRAVSELAVRTTRAAAAAAAAASTSTASASSRTSNGTRRALIPSSAAQPRVAAAQPNRPIAKPIAISSLSPTPAKLGSKGNKGNKGRKPAKTDKAAKAVIKAKAAKAAKAKGKAKAAKAAKAKAKAEAAKIARTNHADKTKGKGKGKGKAPAASRGTQPPKNDSVDRRAPVTTSSSSRPPRPFSKQLAVAAAPRRSLRGSTPAEAPAPQKGVITNRLADQLISRRKSVRKALVQLADADAAVRDEARRVVLSAQLTDSCAGVIEPPLQSPPQSPSESDTSSSSSSSQSSDFPSDASDAGSESLFGDDGDAALEGPPEPADGDLNPPEPADGDLDPPSPPRAGDSSSSVEEDQEVVPQQHAVPRARSLSPEQQSLPASPFYDGCDADLDIGPLAEIPETPLRAQPPERGDLLRAALQSASPDAAPGDCEALHDLIKGQLAGLGIEELRSRFPLPVNPLERHQFLSGLPTAVLEELLGPVAGLVIACNVDARAHSNLVPLGMTFESFGDLCARHLQLYFGEHGFAARLLELLYPRFGQHDLLWHRARAVAMAVLGVDPIVSRMAVVQQLSGHLLLSLDQLFRLCAFTDDLSLPSDGLVGPEHFVLYVKLGLVVAMQGAWALPELPADATPDQVQVHQLLMSLDCPLYGGFVNRVTSNASGPFVPVPIPDCVPQFAGASGPTCLTQCGKLGARQQLADLVDVKNMSFRVALGSYMDKLLPTLTPSDTPSLDAGCDELANHFESLVAWPMPTGRKGIAAFPGMLLSVTAVTFADYVRVARGLYDTLIASAAEAFEHLFRVFKIHVGTAKDPFNLSAQAFAAALRVYETAVIKAVAQLYALCQQDLCAVCGAFEALIARATFLPAAERQDLVERVGEETKTAGDALLTALARTPRDGQHNVFAALFMNKGHSMDDDLLDVRQDLRALLSAPLDKAAVLEKVSPLCVRGKAPQVFRDSVDWPHPTAAKGHEAAHGNSVFDLHQIHKSAGATAGLLLFDAKHLKPEDEGFRRYRAEVRRVIELLYHNDIVTHTEGAQRGAYSLLTYALLTKSEEAAIRRQIQTRPSRSGPTTSRTEAARRQRTTPITYSEDEPDEAFLVIDDDETEGEAAAEKGAGAARKDSDPEPTEVIEHQLSTTFARTQKVVKSWEATHKQAMAAFVFSDSDEEDEPAPPPRKRNGKSPASPERRSRDRDSDGDSDWTPAPTRKQPKPAAAKRRSPQNFSTTTHDSDGSEASLPARKKKPAPEPAASTHDSAQLMDYIHKMQQQLAEQSTLLQQLLRERQPSQ
jgi:hypothetical protein